jgi:hypothetical protein
MPEPERVPDLPEPSPELILLTALTHAHIRSLSRKERDRFLLDVSSSLGLQAAAYNVLRFRPRSEDRAVFRAMTEAGAWWKQILGVLSRTE